MWLSSALSLLLFSCSAVNGEDYGFTATTKEGLNRNKHEYALYKNRIKLLSLHIVDFSTKLGTEIVILIHRVPVVLPVNRL